MENFENPTIVTDEKTPDQIKAGQETEATSKKKGRGRPKKTEKPALGENKAGASVETNEADELNKMRSEYAAKTVTFEVPAEPEAAKKVDSVLSGYMLLMVCDFVFPSLIIMFFKRKRPNLTVKKLKLTDEEKREMADLADEAAKHLVTGMSPLQLFFIGMGAIYLGKMQDVD